MTEDDRPAAWRRWRAADELLSASDLVKFTATTALLQADVKLAEQVVADDEKVDALDRETEERALDLLARQQPVASDLRVIVTGLRMEASIERMGDLAVHIAKIALMRHPNEAVPVEVRQIIKQMGVVAQNVVSKAGAVLAGHDIELAAELERDDDAMDDLHKQLFTVLLNDWQHGIEAAIDVTLLGRFYERYADHAVSLSRRVVQLVTGELPTAR